MIHSMLYLTTLWRSGRDRARSKSSPKLTLSPPALDAGWATHLRRPAVEPVPPRQFVRFLAQWQGLWTPLAGTAGVLAAIEQLAGYPVPASSLESLVLPARVRDYRPAMLDELLAAGEVVWQGAGAQGLRTGGADHGELSLYVERGGRTLLSFTDDPGLLATAAEAIPGAGSG